jgi:hypothetical protein
VPIPAATLSIKDGALGIVPPNVNGIVALVGTSSLGTNNLFYSFSDVQTLRETLGTGPLVEAAAHILTISGGPVYCVKANSSTAGTFGTVTRTGTGVSVLTLTGSVPVDTYDVRVRIVTGGVNPAAGTTTFQVSLDAGRTFGPLTALPASGIFAVPNTGITLNFSAATLVALDVYSFTTTGPSYNTTDLNTAVDVLLADPREWFLLYAVGVPADAAATQGVFAALDSKLAAAANAYRYARGLMQCFTGTDSAIIAAVASLSSTRVMLAAGLAQLLSVVNGALNDRPAATPIAARAARVEPSEDLGRVASGSLPGITSLLRDEFRTPGLDDAGLATLTSIVGLSGFFVGNGRIKAAPTSDFQLLQFGRVMDIASRTVRQGMLRFLNDSVRVSATTGRIREEDAKAIEAYIEGQLRATTTTPGYASDVSVVVDRTVNILSTQRLPVRFRIVPLGYVKFIDGEIGFSNPALTPV